MLITYTRDELIELCRRDVSPVCAVRKATFSHYLWLLAHERQQNEWKSHHRARDRRSADGTGGLVYGLLNARSVGNKSSAIINAIDKLHLDMLLLTETWHTAHDDVALRCCVPPGFTHVDVPRPRGSAAA